MPPDWITRFPELAPLTPAERKLITERAQIVSLPAQTTVFAPGLPAENFLLLLEGTCCTASPAARAAFIGYCPAYRLLGICTTAKKSKQA